MGGLMGGDVNAVDPQEEYVRGLLESLEKFLSGDKAGAQEA